MFYLEEYTMKDNRIEVFGDLKQYAGTARLENTSRTYCLDYQIRDGRFEIISFKEKKTPEKRGVNNNEKAFRCCLYPAIAGSPALAEDGVPAEVPTMVELSGKEINRIVCPGQMSDLIFSKEKGITGHFSGNNAFIKFTIEDKAASSSMPRSLARYMRSATVRFTPSLVLRLRSTR